MIKSELVKIIAKRNPHLYQRDIENVVNAILKTISEALTQGDRVELRGFGTFAVKKRDARAGRNPRTGESVAVGEKFIPVFKTGKEMRKRLQLGPPEDGFDEDALLLAEDDDAPAGSSAGAVEEIRARSDAKV